MRRPRQGSSRNGNWPRRSHSITLCESTASMSAIRCPVTSNSGRLLGGARRSLSCHWLCTATTVRPSTADRSASDSRPRFSRRKSFSVSVQRTRRERRPPRFACTTTARAPCSPAMTRRERPPASSPARTAPATIVSRSTAACATWMGPAGSGPGPHFRPVSLCSSGGDCVVALSMSCHGQSPVVDADHLGAHLAQQPQRVDALLAAVYPHLDPWGHVDRLRPCVGELRAQHLLGAPLGLAQGRVFDHGDRL